MILYFQPVFRRINAALRMGGVGKYRHLRLILALICAANWAMPLHAEMVRTSDAFGQSLAKAAENLRIGRPIAAQIWARRGFGFAQTDREKAALRRVYDLAAQENPITLNFAASAAPSSNINGGAGQEYFSLGDIALAFAPTSRALSGTEIAAQAEFGLRLARGAWGATALGVNVTGRSYALSPDTKAKAPQISGSDYSVLVADVSLRQQIVLGQNRGIATVSAHVGQVEYGRAPLYRYAKLAIGQDRALSDRTRANWGVSYEHQIPQSAARASAQVFDFKSSFSTVAQNQSLWTWTVAGRKTASAFASDTFVEASLGASYSPPQPLFGARPSYALTFGRKTYDTFILSFDGRRDNYATAVLSLVFDQIAVFGFSPVLTVTGTRTLSNVARFDTAEVKASIGVQSRF